MLICIRQLCDFTVGGSWAPWEEPGLPHPPWLAAWKGLQQPLHCRQKGGGAGVCTLEREKHGAWGAGEHGQGPAHSSSMSSTTSGHVVHATTEAAAGRGAGSHPNLFVFATQRWRQSISGGEGLPGLSSRFCSHDSSATLLLLFRGWALLLSSVGVGHH